MTGGTKVTKVKLEHKNFEIPERAIMQPFSCSELINL